MKPAACAPGYWLCIPAVLFSTQSTFSQFDCANSPEQNQFTTACESVVKTYNTQLMHSTNHLE